MESLSSNIVSKSKEAPVPFDMVTDPEPQPCLEPESCAPPVFYPLELSPAEPSPAEPSPSEPCPLQKPPIPEPGESDWGSFMARPVVKIKKKKTAVCAPLPPV
jgi:hypothetical protein